MKWKYDAAIAKLKKTPGQELGTAERKQRADAYLDVIAYSGDNPKSTRVIHSWTQLERENIITFLAAFADVEVFKTLEKPHSKAPDPLSAVGRLFKEE